MSVLNFPTSSPSARYISPNAIAYFYDGYSWCSTGNSINPNPIAGNPFLYRTIYTRGYTHCGYKDSSPWKNTNRTLHATDVTANLGDMMDNNSSYIDGGFSDYNSYVFNNSGSVGGVSNITSSMSMFTESLRTILSSRYMTVSRYNLKALMNPGLTVIYITGGANSTTDKFSTVTDTMLLANSVASGVYGGTGGGLSGFYGQYKGIVGCSSNSGILDWSTETWSSSWSWAGNTDGQPKGLSSKWGYGYNSSGSYPGATTYYKFNDTTGSNTSNFSRPFKAGEENCQIGQDWGYTIGCYNDIIGQNNLSAKVSYLTDSSVQLGSDGEPKGHNGMSSGSCATGSCLILGGIMGTSI
jgi:hypothetical protein